MFLKSYPDWVFDYHNWTVFPLEPYWNTNISETEQYSALKMKMPKGKVVKTQYIKGHLDNFNTLRVIRIQTLEKKPETFPHFWMSPMTQCNRLLKSTDLTNRQSLCTSNCDAAIFLKSFLLFTHFKIAILTLLYKTMGYSVNIHPWLFIFWLSSLYMFIFLQKKYLQNKKFELGPSLWNFVDLTWNDPELIWDKKMILSYQ